MIHVDQLSTGGDILILAGIALALIFFGFGRTMP